jgi:4-amino-4-deoxychorismate lyase
MVQNGLITDTSISNLIFFDGKEWFTPANPILQGTCRDRLMAEGRLIAKEIRIDDLDLFIGCKLINAMRDPEEEWLIAMSEIT